MVSTTNMCGLRRAAHNSQAAARAGPMIFGDSANPASTAPAPSASRNQGGSGRVSSVLVPAVRSAGDRTVCDTLLAFGNLLIQPDVLMDAVGHQIRCFEGFARSASHHPGRLGLFGEGD